MTIRSVVLLSLGMVACCHLTPPPAQPQGTAGTVGSQPQTGQPQSGQVQPNPGQAPTQQPPPAATSGTTDASILARFRQAVGKMTTDPVGRRIVIVDVVYPASPPEFEEMGGCTLMLLSALVWDKEELPFARAFVRFGDETIDLQTAKTRSSELPPSESATAEAIGRYRFDALYYIPVAYTQRTAEVVVDFAKTRKGLVVWKFPAEGSNDKLPAGIDLEAEPRSPSPAAMDAMAKREFPLFWE